MKKLSPMHAAELVNQLKREMGKQYRRDNSVTVEKAVRNISGELDVSLAQCSTAYAIQQLKGFGETAERTGVNNEENKKKKVSEFLEPKYLVD